MGMISFIDMMRQMSAREPNGEPLPFQLKFVTWNRKKKEGGKIIELQNAIRTNLAHSMMKNSTVGVKTLNHNGHPYTVHARLITEFNGQKVFY